MSIAARPSFSKAIITILLMGVLPYSASSVGVFARERSGVTPEVVVVHPSELPPAAQVPAQAMYLHVLGFSRYLYLEQENGRRLAVFDVSQPANIKTVAVIALKTPSFEFLPEVNSQLVLVRFTGSKAPLRLGVLELKHPQKPVLRSLGSSGMSASSPAASVLEQDVGPSAGIPDVRQGIITDEDLGSRFVLTAHGLYVIRQPAVEKKFELEEFESYAG